MKRTSIIIIAAALLVSLGAVFAFAHGTGWIGGDRWGHHGWGHHHRGYYGPGNFDQMSDAQYKQLELKNDAFVKETEALRTSLIDKERTLQKELDKAEPDAAKASGLQKEISALQAQLDQKRIDHIIEMRKLAPHAERSYMPGAPMMGYGPRGGGYCWR